MTADVWDFIGFVALVAFGIWLFARPGDQDAKDSPEGWGSQGPLGG